MDQTQSDKELVEATLRGDREAFGALVERYERSVHAAATQILRDLHLAQDAAQDAFIIAYRTLGSLCDGNAVGPWLLKIARNRAVRMSRDHRQRQLVPAITEAASESNGRLDERSVLLLKALDRLPAHERVVLMLRYFDGHDVEAITRITGRPIGTVTKQLSRAHQRLRRILEDSQ